MPASWQDVRIAAGQTESDEIDMSADDASVPPGKMRKADGSKFQGRDRPRFDVVDSGNGCKIVLDQPASEDVVFKVKAEDADEG